MTATLHSQLDLGTAEQWSPLYEALGFRFVVRTNSRAALAYLRPIFEAFESTAEPEVVYSFGAFDDGHGESYVLSADRDVLHMHRDPAEALSVLFWHVNQQVLAHSQDRLLIHASAVEQGGEAIILPAPPESGKSTLAAGLVRSGFQYLTDEVVAIDRATGVIDPFPRALSVDQGSWHVLADLRPQLPPDTHRFASKQWQIPPQSIRPDAVGTRARPRTIILPRYREGSPTELVPLERVQAVRAMAEQSFNLVVHGGQALAVLAKLARDAQCYRLTVSDLGDACDLIVEATSGRSGERPFARSSERHR